MITTQSDDFQDADQSEDDESAEDLVSTGFSSLRLQAAASSLKPVGGRSRLVASQMTRQILVTREKTCLKTRGPEFATVLRPEGSRDFY